LTAGTRRPPLHMNEVKTHRAVLAARIQFTTQTSSARQPHLREELPKMEAQEELKAHLMATDDEYRRLAAEHSAHARKLDELEALPFLSVEEEMEEHRLK